MGRDGETPRLSDLVMTLGEFIQGAEGLTRSVMSDSQ